MKPPRDRANRPHRGGRLALAVVLLASACSVPVVAPEGLAGEPSARRDEVSTPLGRIHYVEAGSGAPLVLVHGFTGEAWNWRPVVGPLARHWRVLAVDLPGYGYSEVADTTYDPAFLAASIEAFLDALAIERAVVVGNSLGGAVGWVLAGAHPERVEALVLVNAAPPDVTGHLRPFGTTIAYALVHVPWLPEISIAMTPRFVSDWIVRHAVVDDALFTEEDLARYYEAWVGEGHPTAMARTVRAVDGLEGMASLLGRIRCPVLVLWGEEDEILTESAADTLEAAIPGARRVDLPGAGHFPMWDKPDEFVAAVEGFLAQEGVGAAPAPVERVVSGVEGGVAER